MRRAPDPLKAVEDELKVFEIEKAVEMGIIASMVHVGAVGEDGNPARSFPLQLFVAGCGADDCSWPHFIGQQL